MNASKIFNVRHLDDDFLFHCGEKLRYFFDD